MRRLLTDVPARAMARLALIVALCAASACTIRVGSGSIEVVNDLDAGGVGLDIVELWVGPAGTEAFTTEVPLGLSLARGETASIVALEPGSWSVLGVDELGNHYVVDDIGVSAGVATTVVMDDTDLAVAPGPETGGVEVVNGVAWSDADSTLVSLYVDPSGSAAWGAELLGDSSVDPGASVLVDGLDPGAWDVLGVDQDGLSFGLYGVTVSAGVTTQVTLTADDLVSDVTRDTSGTGLIKVVNGVDWADGADYALTDVFLALAPVTTAADWGANLLPAPLAPGASQSFDQVVEGTWEVYAIDDAGNAYLREGVVVWAGNETVVSVTTDDLDP